jgi:prevent-host-death family protein
VWQLQEAKNCFSEVVEAAVSGEPQIITRHGREAVVILSVERYGSLTGRRRWAHSFVDFLLLAPKTNDGLLVARSVGGHGVSESE